MVQNAHSGVNEDKVNEILLAAQNRFGLYGYGKTTMNEIADDLGMSKASLYYYFPDKAQLFRAVFKKEQDDYIKMLNSIANETDNISTLLHKFLHLRMDRFRVFFNLGRAGQDEMKGTSHLNLIKDLWADFRQREKEGITKLFLKGTENMQVNKEEMCEAALLYVEAIMGLAHVFIKSRDISMINENDFLLIRDRIKQFTKIYIKGILSRD